MGAEVLEPFSRNNNIDKTKGPWAYDTGSGDVADIYSSDAIFAILNGTPPDEGVMIELGMMMATGKKIFLFRDDTRSCTESGVYPLNLMIFMGLPRDNWQEWYYTRVEDMTDPDRPLAKWLRGDL